MNVALAKTDKPDIAGEAFAAVRARVQEPVKIAAARTLALDAFQRIGLPHRRIEDWKYTDLRALMKTVAPLAPAPDAATLARAEAAAKLHAIDGVRRIVLVDGVLAPSLSDLAGLEQGLSIRSLREALAGGDEGLMSLDTANPMVALNTALMTDGVVIDVAAGAAIARPLHILHIAASAAATSATRAAVTLGNGASATLVESYVAAEGATAYQSTTPRSSASAIRRGSIMSASSRTRATLSTFRPQP